MCKRFHKKKTISTQVWKQGKNPYHLAIWQTYSISSDLNICLNTISHRPDWTWQIKHRLTTVMTFNVAMAQGTGDEWWHNDHATYQELKRRLISVRGDSNFVRCFSIFIRRIRNCPMRMRMLVHFRRIGNNTIQLLVKRSWPLRIAPFTHFCVLFIKIGAHFVSFWLFQTLTVYTFTYVIHNQAFPNSSRQF